LEVHLIDGTYELFRHYHALPSMRDDTGKEVAAVRGVITSILGMIEKGATHLAVATDHVIESFRNQLWAEYKTGEGIEPDLWAQFPLLEEALTALGVVVWHMIEFEADDALAAAAFAAEKTRRSIGFSFAPQTRTFPSASEEPESSSSTVAKTSFATRLA
jgi:5'-3' exonuclease